MTSLITGAGLVGAAYAKEAVAEGERAVFFDARPDADYLRVKLGGAPYEAIQGDLRDLPALVGAMQAHSPEVVVHTAGLIGASVQNPLYTGMQVNVQGMINALEAARLTGIKRFVHISTDGVYDRRAAPAGAVREDHPRSVEGSPYLSTKAANEHIAEAYAAIYGFELVIIRPANVFGYGHFRGGSRGGRAVHSLVEAGLSGEPLVMPAARARPSEHIYCKDLGRLIRRAATAPASGVEAFNAGNGYITTFEELADAVRAELPALDATAAPAEGTPPSPPAPLDISRAKALLDWTPAHSIAEAFADYIAETRAAQGA